VVRRSRKQAAYASRGQPEAGVLEPWLACDLGEGDGVGFVEGNGEGQKLIARRRHHAYNRGVRRTTPQTEDAASLSGQSAQAKPGRTENLHYAGGSAATVPTFTQEGSASLAPLTFGDLQEIRSSMALEGFVIPEERFNAIVNDVRASLADDSVSNAILRAQQWLASSKANP
jgi:hypothetical protein